MHASSNSERTWPRRLVVSVLVTAVLLTIPGLTKSRDLHRMWDDRCFECHGHAAEFARRALTVEGAELQGRHHVHDLKKFLVNHYLSGDEVDAVYEMLRAQAATQSQFRDNCSRCHGTAAKFVRSSIELRDGVSYGRGSGASVSEFLRNHQRLSAMEVDFYARVLTRVAREVYRGN